jgi:2'-5' RNA ligase
MGCHVQSLDQDASSRVGSLLGRMYRYILRGGEGGSVQRSRQGRTFELAYVILVSDEVHNYMSKLEVDLMKQYGAHEGLKATPHITLKLGFHVTDIEPFERYFDELVNEIEPFEICVKNFGFFDEAGIVYLDIVHTPELDSLRRRIVNDLSMQHGIKPNVLEGDQYHFHATLAYLSKHDFSQARREFEHVKIERRFMLNALGLICHTGDGWITYKRGRLPQVPAELSGRGLNSA